MSQIRTIISAGVEGVKKKTKLFKDIWSRRIDYAIAQLIATRLFYGKAHEGEMGLAVAKFVRETWRSISAIRKLDKLSKSDIGKAYIVKLILDNVAKEKRYTLLSEFAKLKDKDGLDFLEEVKRILETKLSKEEYTKINNLLGRHLAHIISNSDGTAIFDPISSKLYFIDQEGVAQEKTLDLKNPNDIIELMSYGLLDKKKDIYAELAEWKMLQLIREGEMKGLKGKNLGIYVYARLKEELAKDPHFFECFRYYIAKHIDQLEKSRMAMIAFGDIIIHWTKLQAKAATAAARAMRYLPFAGVLAEPFIALAEGLAGIGEEAREATKKRSSKLSTDSREWRTPAK